LCPGFEGSSECCYTLTTSLGAIFGFTIIIELAFAGAGAFIAIFFPDKLRVDAWFAAELCGCFDGSVLHLGTVTASPGALGEL
jgi:hypothetical protein